MLLVDSIILRQHKPVGTIQGRILNISLAVALNTVAYPGFEGGRCYVGRSRAKCARKIFSHAPKTLTTPLIYTFLQDSWLTKKAVLGLVMMRIRCLRNEFLGLVSLLLVGAASYRLSLTIILC